MRILYLENDLEQARNCHAKLLAYKGIHWELQHCGRVDAALQALSNDSIDVVLVGIRPSQAISGELQQFLDASHSLPRLAIVDSLAETRIRNGSSSALSIAWPANS